MRRTLHLTHTSNDMLMLIYINRLKKGERATFSSLVDEAIVLLHKKMEEEMMELMRDVDKIAHTVEHGWLYKDKK